MTLPRNSINSAAVSWVDQGGQVHIRVYWSDGYHIAERCFDAGGWTDGAFKAAGEAVSATLWVKNDASNIRVYCTFEGKTVEWCVDNGSADWYQGAFTLG